MPYNTPNAPMATYKLQWRTLPSEPEWEYDIDRKADEHAIEYAKRLLASSAALRGSALGLLVWRMYSGNTMDQAVLIADLVLDKLTVDHIRNLRS